MSMQEKPIDEKLLAACRRRYANFSDEALAAVAAGSPDDLSTEARTALEAEVATRDQASLGRWGDAIQEKRAAVAVKRAQAPVPDQRWEDRRQTTSVYAQSTRIARWLAFLPAAWQAGNVHGWILRAFGIGRVSEIGFVSDEYLLAFGVAGFLTPIVVIALGAWICPARKKVVPVVVLCMLCIAGGINTLHMFSGAAGNPQLRHLFGLDAIVTIGVSVMIAGVCWLAPWQKRAHPSEASIVATCEETDAA